MVFTALPFGTVRLAAASCPKSVAAVRQARHRVRLRPNLNSIIVASQMSESHSDIYAVGQSRPEGESHPSTVAALEIVEQVAMRSVTWKWAELHIIAIVTGHIAQHF